MKYKKIALFGKMGSGKSNLVSNLTNYKRFSFGDAVKSQVLSYDLVPGKTIDKSRDRKTLQSYGQFRRGDILNFDFINSMNESGSAFRYHKFGYSEIVKPNQTEVKALGLCYPDYWIDQVRPDIQKYIENGENIVNDDIRRKNEWNALKDLDFLMIKVQTDEDLRIERMNIRDNGVNLETLNDISETEIDELPYDYLIENNDTIEQAWNTLLNIII